MGSIYGEERTDEADNETKPLIAREIIKAPITGQLVALEDVPDEAFSTGILGKGIAINPTEGRVVAPSDATVVTLFPTCHAIGLITDHGTELLIHIGMDTVKLDGKYFVPAVQQGEHVKAGQTLITFDLEKIHDAGYSMITPVLVTNHEEYMDVVSTDDRCVNREDNLITVIA